MWRNHYGIKLPRGYRISINVKDNQLILKNGQNDITGESGKDYVSTEAISILNQNNINVILTDTYGNPISFMNDRMISNTAIKYRMGQYDTFRDPMRCCSCKNGF